MDENVKIFDSLPANGWLNGLSVSPFAPFEGSSDWLDYRLVLHNPRVIPIKTLINEGQGSELTYTESYSEGFELTASEEVSITASVSVEFAGIGGGVEVSGTVGFSQGKSTEKTEEISVTIQPGHQVHIFEGVCLATQIICKKVNSGTGSGAAYGKTFPYKTGFIKTVSEALS